MNDTNHVVLIGRLVRDAELKYTAAGKALSKFTLAVNEQRKVGDKWENDAGFFEVNLWGQLGESLDKYLKKGKQVAITGKLKQERWQQDGYSRSKVIVTAVTIQLFAGASGNDAGAGENNNPPPSDDNYTDDIPF